MRNNDVTVVRSLSRLAAVFAALTLLSGCASVMMATRDDDRATLKSLLASGEAADPPEESEVTPLAVAIDQNNLELVKILVEGGADPNRVSACNGLKVPPLFKAAIHGHLEIAKYLLDKGADATAIASGDNVFILMAKQRTQADTNLVTSAILSDLTQKHGRDEMLSFVNRQTPSGWTALTAAAWFGDRWMMSQLLEYDASTAVTAKASNVTTWFSDEWPPLIFAQYRGREEFVSDLVQGGADPKQPSSSGMSMQEIAAARAERQAQEDAWQAQLEAQRRQDEREEEAERAAANQQFGEAFMNQMTQGMTGDPNAKWGEIQNPLDDPKYQQQQDQWMQMAKDAQEKKEREQEQKQQQLAEARCRDEIVRTPRCRHILGEDVAEQQSADAQGEGSSGDASRRREEEQARQETAAREQREQEEQKREEDRKKREEEQRARDEEEQRRREESERKAREEQQRRAEQEQKQRRVLAYARVNERLSNGCERSVLVAFDEMTLQGNFSSEYSAFQRSIRSQYPTGQGQPYVDWETVTTFVKSDEVIVVVQFTVRHGKCNNRLIAYAVGRTYDEAWRNMQSVANREGWEAVELIKRWPTPTTGDPYGD